jgi:uncharacterized protein (TIGR00730 family)
MMGALARAARSGGARTIGVIPRQLTGAELADLDAEELVVVETMRERKAIMDARSDAFLALPGGLGTLEELFEVLTWAQLGLHTKPIGLLDVGGFYQPLLSTLEHMVAEGFIAPVHMRLLVARSRPAALLDALATYAAPVLTRKWLTPAET